MVKKPTYAELEKRIRELEQTESEYKRVKEAVEYKRVEHDMILDSQLELIVYEDTDMRILWPNKSACESVNMTREELVGRHCYEIWPQRLEPCEDCPVIAAMETGQHESVEKSTPDGRSWFIRGYPVLDAKGEIIGLSRSRRTSPTASGPKRSRRSCRCNWPMLLKWPISVTGSAMFQITSSHSTTISTRSIVLQPTKSAVIQ